MDINTLESASRGCEGLSYEVFEGVRKLIESSPFREKIEDLISRKQDPKSNCIGRALYIAGIGKHQHPYHGYDNEISPIMNRHFDQETLILGIENSENKIPGAFVFSYSENVDGWHAGIYLGSVQGIDFAFAQHGAGGKFVVEKISYCYENPNYYT